MKKSLIIISLLISSIFAEDYAGLSGSFMRLGITARSIAMGGAFTAEKDHGFSTFYNPAWAAFLIDRRCPSLIKGFQGGYLSLIHI